ncbi:hypothetical protein [Kineosporia sp. NBRC 101731]|uniref:hypothetical protein n=1 Tax=Kineosporia sp. NBRC 101731 TaxID=3032199 RepID=UPI0024A3CCFE|nr:hypothetical protein [Kineosporia sp. NBRC 101731]GLY32125.1 hypothetical protein Kisp02_54900 [Kineosporia sp. NBRC 101731]
MTGRGANGADETSTPTATPAIVETPKTKRKTRAALQREKDEAIQVAAADAILDRAETFAVTFPTGISVHVGKDVDEMTVEVGGTERWVEQVDGFVTLPYDARVRAVSLAQLEDFRRMAGQSMLRIVPTDPQPVVEE